jgi:hypothetical protein
MSGNERSCSSCSSENIRAATATTPTTHGQTVRTVVTAISTRPPNAHNRCSAISDQNFPLATRTPAREDDLELLAQNGGTTFTTLSGQPMTFARGQVWVVLTAVP